MTLTLSAALSMILMRLVSSEGWQKHLEEQGFVFPLGRLDPSLHARILDQVTVWESEGEMLGEAKSTWNAHLRSDAVMEAATNSQILDAVQEVLGEDVVLLHTTFFAKYPQNTTDQNAPKCLTVIGTHQDRTYWVSTQSLSQWSVYGLQLTMSPQRMGQCALPQAVTRKSLSMSWDTMSARHLGKLKVFV